MRFEFIHTLAHDHPAAHVHEGLEDDPCHRVIYHLDTENGCDHKSHYVASEKCSLCDVVIQKSDYTLEVFALRVAEPLHDSSNTLFLFRDFSSEATSSSRAPPAV